MTRPGRLVTRRALAAALLLALAPAPARAWDDVGHMTIAGIAWQRLSPAARARAVALLRAAPGDAGLAQLRPNAGGPEERDRALFERAATWADVVRDRSQQARLRRYHRSAWHYVNLYWRTDAGGRAVDAGIPTERENAVERIGALTASLADARRLPADRAIDLAWLLHLVGDVHQPLHCSSRVTAADPRGDKGGNGLRVGSTNLHSLWDNAMDRSPGRQPGRRGGRQQGEDAKRARAEQWAARLSRAYPPERWRASLADTVPMSWARAGVRLAQQYVYAPGIADSAPIPPGYVDEMRQVVEPQVALAGYRLAALLERALVTR